MTLYGDDTPLHPAKLWTDMNPDFFRGTVVEKDAAKLLAQSPHLSLPEGLASLFIT